MTLDDLIGYLQKWRADHPGSGIQSVGVSVDGGEWHSRLEPPLHEERKRPRDPRAACSDLEFHIP